MKNLYLLCVLLWFTGITYAQSFAGLKSGIALPGMVGSTENASGYVSRLKWNGGLSFYKHLKDEWGLQAEVNYAPQQAIRQGMQQLTDPQYDKLSVPGGTFLYANYRHTLSFNFVEIPLLAKFSIGEKLRYSFLAGPHIAVLLKSKSQVCGNSDIYRNAAGTELYLPAGEPLTNELLNSDQNTTGNYKKITFGAQGGLELSYPLRGGVIFAETRTIVGLSNLNKKHITEEKLYTGAFTFCVGYNFKITRSFLQKN